MTYSQLGVSQQAAMQEFKMANMIRLALGRKSLGDKTLQLIALYSCEEMLGQVLCIFEDLIKLANDIEYFAKEKLKPFANTTKLNFRQETETKALGKYYYDYLSVLYQARLMFGPDESWFDNCQAFKQYLTSEEWTYAKQREYGSWY